MCAGMRPFDILVLLFFTRLFYFLGVVENR